MNLRQAHYLKTIAKEGSITAAAKHLMISQPSLSQTLRQIETDCGAILFERRGSSLVPTYAGECCLRAASQLLNTNEVLENELREIRGEKRGLLRLGISMQRASHTLPQILPAFFREYPNVELRLLEAGSAKLEQYVLDGTADLALLSAEPVQPQLSYRLLCKERIGILTGPGSPIATKIPVGTPISLTSAAEMNCRFLSLKSGHNARIVQDRLLLEHGLHPVFALETDSMEAAQRIAQTAGLCLICTDSCLPADACFYPIKNCGNERHFYACTKKGAHIPQYMEFLIRCAKEACFMPSQAARRSQ